MQQPTNKHADEKHYANPRSSSTIPSTPSSRQQGLLSILPAPWAPYAELMRLDRPAGFYAFYIPYLIGLGYAACLADPIPSPTRLYTLSSIFFIGCIILRGAACAWNDNVDQEFDRKVARCQNRPIARGAITTTQGHTFTAALALAGAPLFLVLPVECSYYALPITILFGAYALMKGVTNYPQVVLGFPFACGILMSCAALEVDALSEQLCLPTLGLFGANVLWTMIYDTIYAHQDLKDDVKRNCLRKHDRQSQIKRAGQLRLVLPSWLLVCGREYPDRPIWRIFCTVAKVGSAKF